ncbi:MAG: hypothetical protein A2X12_05470 [Bacteroidetes bacterium GWE2_29_8]|nr:MAG: hypothetical protein A2X12_05470 [Bacteroidetes bacterium GWE2_29_8]
MFVKLKDTLSRKLNHAVIGIEKKADNSELYRYFLFKIKDDNILIVNHVCSESIDDIVPLLSYSVPTSVVIYGKNVITRNLDTSGGLDYEGLIRMIIPNVNIDDFFLQELKLTEKESIVSIIRTDFFVEIIKKVSINGLLLTNVYIGPLVFSAVANELNYKSEITINKYCFTLDGLKIKKIDTVLENDEDKIIFKGLEINQDNSLEFSAGYNYFFKKIKLLSSEQAELKNRENEFDDFLTVRLLAILSLITFFILLLVNFFIYDYFYSKYNYLENKTATYNDYIIKRNNLEKLVNEKKKFLETNGFLEKTKFSYYADRIASMIPNEIILNQMTLNPLKKRKNDNSEFEVERNYIIINGSTRNTIVLNNWINDLKKLRWIKNVEISFYNHEEQVAPALFTIKLILEND